MNPYGLTPQPQTLPADAMAAKLRLGAECRRQLAMEPEIIAARMGMATYSSGPMPLPDESWHLPHMEALMQRRDFGDTDLGFVHKSAPGALSGPASWYGSLPKCAGYCNSGRRPCETPAICLGGDLDSHVRKRCIGPRTVPQPAIFGAGSSMFFRPVMTLWESLSAWLRHAWHG